MQNDPERRSDVRGARADRYALGTRQARRCCAVATDAISQRSDLRDIKESVVIRACRVADIIDKTQAKYVERHPDIRNSAQASFIQSPLARPRHPGPLGISYIPNQNGLRDVSPRSRSCSTTCGGEDRIRIAPLTENTEKNAPMGADPLIDSPLSETPNSAIVGGRSIASEPIDCSIDVVEAALAGALSQAATAGQWELVARLAGELDARRRARSETIDLQAERAKRGQR